jgi:hypothetical protein
MSNATEAPADRAIYNKTQAAQKLGISVYQVNNLIAAGQLRTLAGLPSKISAAEMARFQRGEV